MNILERQYLNVLILLAAQKYHMNYLDIYFSRTNYFGETQAERIKNSGILAFEKWMAQSPFTVTDLSVERGYYFSGIIQTSKDKAEQKLMYLYVANDIPIRVGDILTWRQDNGVIEKWLLLQKIHKVHEQYQTFQIIKCNYELKWIDADGYLHKSWAYAVSSVDNMIKGNFRMWHSLISPQPNKFAEIIMPRPELKGTDRDQLLRGINFIIEDEAWTIIECDWTSVEGIIYMSLTESKVNYQYDDRDIEVADLDRLKFPILQPLYIVGDSIVPEFEEDTLNEWEIELIPSDESLVERDENNHWRAIASGKITFTMKLKGNNAVTKEFEILINEPEVEFSAFIEGPDEIKLDRYGTYSLVGTSAILGEVRFNMIQNQYATISTTETNKCTIHANAKNKLGEIILSATYNDITYTKTIKIVPLW